MRRRLQAGLAGLGEGLKELGMGYLMKQAKMEHATPDTPEPQTPFTGSGSSGPPAQGDASQKNMPGEVEDPYILPARPSTLFQESDPALNPAIQLARRHLSPPMFGRRRI